MTVTTLAYISSPAQGVWFIGPVPIRAYALCIIAGIIAALVIGDRRWEARGGERGVIYDIALWAVPFGLVGGRLYHVLTDWPTYFGAGGAGLGAAFRIWDGGLGIWGAVALGAVGAWIGCRRRGIPLPAFGDAVAPGIILAQAIGRLGNYFNQELYGRATDLPWGLEIYERRDAAGFRDSLNGVSTGELVGVVHPTFLYELVWNLLIFGLLIWIDRRYKLGHGRVFALYVAGYCLGRFWIELMRADTATLIAGIRVNSFTSTFIFIAAVVYIMVAPKGREDPASLWGNAPRDDALPDSDVKADDSATEVIEVGAVAGVVAAAKVAGAAQTQDAALPGGSSDAADPVVEAADEADDVEEPVETEMLVIAEPEPVAAVEPAVAVEPEPEADAAVVAEIDQPVLAEVVPEEVVAELESESAEEAEGDSVADEATEDEAAVEPEPEAADAAEAAEIDEPVVVEVVPEEVVAELESESAEEAEGDSVADEAADPEVAEAAELDDVVDEPVAATEDAEVEAEVIAAEVLGAVDAATAEAAEGELAEVDAEEPAADESAVDEPAAADASAEVAEGDSGDVEAALADVTVVEESVEESAEPVDAGAADSTPQPEESADKPADHITAEPVHDATPAVGERFRKPRWFRRNG